MDRCSTSGEHIVNATAESGAASKFGCPRCGTKIVRSVTCRLKGIPYVCPQCGFKGP